MSDSTENEEVIESGNPLESGDALSKEALSVCEDTEGELVYVEGVVKLRKLRREAESHARREQTVSSVSETTAAPTETTTAAPAETTTAAPAETTTAVPAETTTAAPAETTTAAPAETTTAVPAETTTAAPAETTTAAPAETTTAAPAETTTAVPAETTTAASVETVTSEVKAGTVVDSYVPTPDTQIDTPDKAADEIKNILTSLCTEIRPDATGSIVLTSAQMGKLDRISNLRYKRFVPTEFESLVAALNNRVVLTPDDLKDKKSMKEARKKLNDALKLEKKYNKELAKLVDKYVEYLNAKNSTNYNLTKIGVLGQINDALDQGIHINSSLAFLPENGPLIVDIFRNCKNIKSGKHVQIPYQGKSIDVYSETNVGYARGAVEQLTTCGGYANFGEKWLTENTKMSQGQARNMISTLGSVGMVGAVIGIGYWLFTEKSGDGRKFSLPSLGKLAAVIGIPLALNYGSQMATGNSFMDNLSRLWRTGEFPWGSSALEGQSLSEQLAAQQVMGQFVLLGVPFSVLAKGTISGKKLTKVNLDEVSNYLSARESITGGSEQMRIRTQLEAIKHLDSNAKLALDNYVANLNISESELKDPSKGNETLDARLGKANEKYGKMLNYLDSKGLEINPDKKDKIVDKLFKTDELTEKVFDQMKEEGCFIPKSPVYQEIAKLSGVDTERKVKFYEAYDKIIKESTKFGNIELKVNGGKIMLSSGKSKDGTPIEIPLNPDLTIDGLAYDDAGSNKIKFGSEEELLRVGLLVNSIRSVGIDNDNSVWDKTPVAKDGDESKWPFAISSVSSGLKFWDDIEFREHNGGKPVLSSLVPFFSEMAVKYPTIEKDSNREFFVKYLNKLWIADPNTSKGTV